MTNSSSVAVKVAPLRREHVAAHLVQVEVAGEEVVNVAGTEDQRLVSRQTARRGRAHVQQDGHDLRPGPLVGRFEDRTVDLAVDAAVNRMDQTIALAAAGMLEEGAGEDSLATRSEGDVDGIVHASGHHWLDAVYHQAGSGRCAPHG